MKTESAENDSEDMSTSYDDCWVVKFISKNENRYLARISESFLQDRFNFYGMKEKIEDFDTAYQAILDKGEGGIPDTEAVVYYLAHQRYIYTKTGLDSILDRVLDREFGTCHKIGCHDIPYIPIGLSNEPRKSGTKAFCYNCESLYEPRSSLRRLDGSAWGSSFAHFLILSFPYHFEKKMIEPYVPRIFGFQIAEPEDNDSA